ncbi:hypothetical protein KGM_200653 [Danaus plexippus plexippus]|uniref:Uncharacterized protein n=1 Tax=Danaus plexippus plexippus TaxID=278856 RepID=A0A212F3Q0_DANPL|nr:hypothetical protein KGM_200653 [Danaus plexippus plexippus]
MDARARPRGKYCQFMMRTECCVFSVIERHHLPPTTQALIRLDRYHLNIYGRCRAEVVVWC